MEQGLGEITKRHHLLAKEIAVSHDCQRSEQIRHIEKEEPLCFSKQGYIVSLDCRVV